MELKPTMNIAITKNANPTDPSAARNYELKMPLGAPLGELYDVVFEILQKVAQEITKSSAPATQPSQGIVVNPSDPADAAPAGSTNAS